MPSGEAIGLGIAEGLNKATTNMFNIMIAKKKLGMEEERLKVDSKYKNAVADKKVEGKSGDDCGCCCCEHDNKEDKTKKQ